MSALSYLSYAYARVMVEDSDKTRDPCPGCSSCHRGIESHDQFCRHCGTKRPYLRRFKDRDMRFSVTVWRLDGECYPDKGYGPDPETAAEKVKAELERRTS